MKCRKLQIPVGKEGTLLFYDAKELISIGIKSILIVLLLGFTFYSSPYACLILLPIGFLYFRLCQKELLQKKKNEIREQFKELLLLVITGQQAGYSIENAFSGCSDDIGLLFGKDSVMYQVLLRLQAGWENGVTYEAMWKTIGMELEIDEIDDFTQIYAIAHDKSGNLTEIMDKTTGIIISRTELKKELYLSIRARKYELSIMNTMPFIMVLYIRLTSPGYFDCLYHTWEGRFLMTFFMLIYLCSYWISYRMLQAGAGNE